MNDIFYAIDNAPADTFLIVLIIAFFAAIIVILIPEIIRDRRYKRSLREKQRKQESVNHMPLDFTTYNGNGKVVNLDARIKANADEIRKVTEGRD